MYGKPLIPTNNYDLAARKQETGKDLREQLKGWAVSPLLVLFLPRRAMAGSPLSAIAAGDM
jgi:hypothetical protein